MKIFKSRNNVILTVAVIICIVLIVLTSTDRTPSFITNSLASIIVPVQNAMSNTALWFSNLGYHAMGTGPLIEENTRLTSEIEELLLILNRLEALEEENYNLTNLLDMSLRYPRFITTGAHIIARDNNNWNSRFTINKGYNNGVTQNMILVARGGLVGKINYSASNFSRVTPIIDDTSTVGAVTTRSGTVGFIRGNLQLSNQGLVIFETDQGTDIIEGDEIMTSAFGTIFPPGIRIGTITEIPDTSGTSVIAVVQPIVDFSNLNSALVITSTSDIG